MNETSQPSRAFKLFGLQRTGTNLTKRGLLANFAVRSGERGREWKHGRIKRAAEDGLDIVVCTRHPLAWLDAMFRFSQRANDRDGCKHFKRSWTFDRFCTSQHYHWQNPVLRWNEMNRHYHDWITDHPKQGLLVRSEDLLGTCEQAEQFKRVGAFFNWPRKDEVVHTFRRRIRHVAPALGAKMNWEYYREEQFLAVYDQEVLARVIEQIDKDLALTLSYTIPTSEAATAAA